MLTMLGSPRRCCDGLTRRETLKVGALTALGGFGLADALRAEATGQALPGKAKSVIVLYLLGGAATQDMFDLKPSAPAEVRSQFNPIATSSPGVEICEHLPQMAKWMHKAAIVRSVNHQAGCHNTLPSYTGHEVMLSDITATSPTYPPSMGSVCEYLRQHGMDGVGPSSPLPAAGRGVRGEGFAERDNSAEFEHPGPSPPTPLPKRERGGDPAFPAYFYLPCQLGWGQLIQRPGPYAGFLGGRYDAVTTDCEPTMAEGVPAPVPGKPQVALGAPRLPQSVLEAGLTIDRLNQRRSLVGQFDDQLRRLDERGPSETFDRHRQRAFDILTSSRLKEAFDTSAETPALVDRYGRTLFGQSALIARRLVERGARFVNVTWDLFWDRIKIDYDAWDTHTNNFGILKENKLPGLDQVFSALMQDLDDRGLLDETLILLTSEMGRTPRINGNAGRDHWTYCYSTLFAGAGIRGGTIYGASDSQAAYVKDKPVSTADICATVYQSLGIDPAFRVPDRFGRPIEIAHGGRPIEEILS